MLIDLNVTRKGCCGLRDRINCFSLCHSHTKYLAKKSHSGTIAWMSLTSTHHHSRNSASRPFAPHSTLPIYNGENSATFLIVTRLPSFVQSLVGAMVPAHGMRCREEKEDLSAAYQHLAGTPSKPT